jgi:hypothetical protein
VYNDRYLLVVYDDYYMLMGHDVLAVNGNCFFFFFHKLLVPDTMANLFMSVSLVRKGEHIVKNTTTLPLCCSVPFPSERSSYVIFFFKSFYISSKS